MKALEGRRGMDSNLPREGTGQIRLAIKGDKEWK
jgi:hypothetical protein